MASVQDHSGSPLTSPSSRVPVLFIATAGRSGSTLLDRVIGTQDGFLSCGELRFIWERSYSENQLCGCGQPFHECSFWEDVSQRAFGVSTGHFDAKHAIMLRRFLDEIRRALRLVSPYETPTFRETLSDYIELLDRLYSAIRQTSAGVIVDSSGDPTHGLILARVPGIELHVIHLVRDARAVAFSWKRVRRRPEIHWKHEDMPIESTAASARLWLAHNALAEILAHRAESYRRLRYEDFAADPESHLTRILEQHGGPKIAADLKEIVLTPAHTVSGNPMRFTQGRISIKADDEWRSAMARRDRWLATALTAPLLARYGYLT